MRTIGVGLLVVALGIAAGGCSRQAVYDALQTTQRRQCLELDAAQQSACAAAAETSWLQYEGARTATH
jgi:hypothetical protein